MKRHRQFVTILIPLVLLLVLITPGRAWATTSPTQCDTNPPPKYACAYINYSIYRDQYNQAVYRVDSRWYQGATDDGAEQWQILYFNDYRWNGSQWVLTKAFGPGSWHYEYSLSNWYVYNTQNPQYGSAMSQAQFRYYEVTPQYPNGYYWTWAPFTFYVT